MKAKKNAADSAVMYIMSFLVFMSCFILICVILCKATIGSERFMIKAFDDSGYAEMTADDIYENLNTGAEISGITEENYFETIIPREQLVDTINKFFTESVEGKSPKADISEFEKLVEQGINEYVEKSGVSDIDEDELDENVNAFVDESTDTYRQLVELKFLPEAGKVLRMFDTPLNICIAVMTVIIGILIFISYKALRNKKMLFDIGIISISGVFIFVAACVIYIYTANMSERIGIGSYALYSFVSTVISRMIYTAFVLAIVLAVVLILLAVLKYFFRDGKSQNIEDDETLENEN